MLDLTTTFATFPILEYDPAEAQFTDTAVFSILKAT